MSARRWIQRGADAVVLANVIIPVVLMGLLILAARAWGASSPPVELTAEQTADSVLLSVLWSQVDTFTTYDVELLRSSDPDEPPANVVAARAGVGDLDASFFQLRPGPGLWACFAARVRAAGVFDVPGDTNGPAPWGLSDTLCMRTPNPPPGPPDVQIDTAAVVGAAGEYLGTFHATLPSSYGAGSWRIIDGRPPGDVPVVLAGVGHRRELCTYASVCDCPESGNDWCPCTVDGWGPLVRFELVGGGGRLELVDPSEYLPMNEGSPYRYAQAYAYGTCMSVRRIA